MNGLVDEKKAAKFLDVAVQTLRNWRCQRRGPSYVKMSQRAIRYRMDDLVKYIEGCRIELAGDNS